MLLIQVRWMRAIVYFPINYIAQQLFIGSNYVDWVTVTT